MKRYSLDKKGPAMFEHRSGGWVKWGDHLKALQDALAHIAALESKSPPTLFTKDPAPSCTVPPGRPRK